MRLQATRALVRSVMLIALGGMALLTPLARASITATTCVSPIPGLGHIGLQLDLLAPATNCASGFAPGLHYATVASVTFALSLSALLVGVTGVVVGIVTSLGCRNLVRSVRAWVADRLGLRPEPTRITRTPGQPVMAVVRVEASEAQRRGPYRRGPPCAR